MYSARMLTSCLCLFCWKMNKRVVKLEVENKELRVKCEKSDVSIINMLDEVQHRCKSSSSLRVAQCVAMHTLSLYFFMCRVSCCWQIVTSGSIFSLVHRGQQ